MSNIHISTARFEGGVNIVHVAEQVTVDIDNMAPVVIRVGRNAFVDIHSTKIPTPVTMSWFEFNLLPFIRTDGLCPVDLEAQQLEMRKQYNRIRSEKRERLYNILNKLTLEEQQLLKEGFMEEWL